MFKGLTVGVGVGVGVGVSVGLVSVPTYAYASTNTATRAATVISGIATVGALFPGSTSSAHTCTASVVRSRNLNLLITAAHCIRGSGTRYTFVPGYNKGVMPYGAWHVARAYVDPSWMRSHNPQADVAVLQVASQVRFGKRVNIEQVTGSNILGSAAASGSTITDVAYNNGVRDQPISCSPTVYRTFGYPAFDCHDYVDGSSGSPWLQKRGNASYVTGVIGGLHEGGCSEATSYSANFESREMVLFNRAQAGGTGDTVTDPASSGCS